VGNLKVNKFEIEGLLEIQASVFPDSRGFFFESYNVKSFQEIGINTQFVQDNQSHSSKGVIRGLHFQREPYAQAKLVRVLKGRILDVAVDIRKSSPTFGKHLAIELSSEKNNMLFIPAGFAHGFHALEESDVLYKCTNYYHKPSESGILWNDADVAINWNATNPNVSEKDIILPTLQQLINVGDLFE
jgi:dTDP-4-dehydrorhamnose 3,5-epimerase